MGFFNDFADALEGAAKQVSKKASEFADSSKKVLETSAIKERLSREYEKLGRFICKDDVLAVTVKSSNEEYAKVLDKISELRAELKAKTSDVKICTCGKTISSKGNYCAYCGAKIR